MVRKITNQNVLHELTGKVFYQNWLCQKWYHRPGSTPAITGFWAMNGLMAKRFVLQFAVFPRLPCKQARAPSPAKIFPWRLRGEKNRARKILNTNLWSTKSTDSLIFITFQIPKMFWYYQTNVEMLHRGQCRNFSQLLEAALFAQSFQTPEK